MAKGEPEVYRPAEACRIAEVAPYVLRYWETEFAALSEGRDKGGAKLYTARDVKIIARIRELLYDEGFTVAGAKKRLEAEIAEGRFEDGLKTAPPPSEQKKVPKAAPPPRSPAVAARGPELAEPVFLSEHAAPSNSARATATASPDFLERKRVVQELKEIVKLLDRGRAR